MTLTKHSVEQIRSVKQSLAVLPSPSSEVNGVTVHKAIAMLADEIQALRDKGYTYPMIADILTTNGIRISGRTLGTYMSRLKNSGTAKPTHKRKATTPSSQGMADKTVGSPKRGKPAIAAVAPLVNTSPLSREHSSARFSPVPDSDDI
ncbi:MAG: hypothetical protein V4724_07395 [Pseudomonadota bacterium]